MIKDSVAVFDMCSSKISAVIGENGVNGNFVIRSIAEIPCEPFLDGKIEDGSSLTAALTKAFDTVCKTASVKLSKVYVSVSNQFLKSYNRTYEKSYPRRRKLKRKDVVKYFDEAQEYANLSKKGYEIIDRRPVFFHLDGNRRVEDILGETTMNVKGYITYFLADVEYTGFMREQFNKLGVSQVCFVPTSIAESYLLFSSEERFSFRILLDVGYITTDLSIIYGGGLLYSAAFMTGGGFITASLCESMNIKYDLADRLKRRINLSVPIDTDGIYELNWGEEVYSFSQKKCNSCVRAVLDGIVEMVDKAILDSRVKLPRDAVIYMTGGGLAYIRGAKEYLFSGIEMPVYVTQPDLVYMSKPEESSKIALLNYALNKRGY